MTPSWTGGKFQISGADEIFTAHPERSLGFSNFIPQRQLIKLCKTDGSDCKKKRSLYRMESKTRRGSSPLRNFRSLSSSCHYQAFSPGENKGNKTYFREKMYKNGPISRDMSVITGKISAFIPLRDESKISFFLHFLWKFSEIPREIPF